jgi:protein-tyrosine phosphatase
MNRLIFVCMGNICRSPLAEVLAKASLVRSGLGERLEVVSRGTHAYHLDHPADPRSIAVAERHGLDLSQHASRLVMPGDFGSRDLLLVMDRRNLMDVRAKAPPHAVGRIRLLMEFAGKPGVEVPDPYYGTAQDFDRIFDMLQEGTEGLTKHLLRLHNAGVLNME